MKVIKYCIILMLVMVIDITNAGNSNDDTDTDSSKSFRGTSRQKNQYYAYVNPKFTGITNRMNQMSASVRAFRNQNKMDAYASKHNLLISQYTKPILSYANFLRPASINTMQNTLKNTVYAKQFGVSNRQITTNIQGIPRKTLYQKATVGFNQPTPTNTNMVKGTHSNAVYYKAPAVSHRPVSTNINTIQASAKLSPNVNTIYKPELSNVNTVGIKTKSLPNRIVYTNPITGGTTIFVRNVDENTYSQPEKAVNAVVQLTTPSPNSIVPLPDIYNTKTRIPASHNAYYQINTTPVPTAAPMLHNFMYMSSDTNQIRGDQNIARMNTKQSPNVIQPHNTVSNGQMTAEYPFNYPLPASNTITGSQITNNLPISKTYPTTNQHTNQNNQSPSNQVYTKTVNHPQPIPQNQYLTSDTGNALNFVRAFFQQLMEQQQQQSPRQQQPPTRNRYEIATSPTSKYNM